MNTIDCCSDHSRDSTSIQESGFTNWPANTQTDLTHCMPAVLISVVLHRKTQCDYVRMLQCGARIGLSVLSLQHYSTHCLASVFAVWFVMWPICSLTVRAAVWCKLVPAKRLCLICLTADDTGLQKTPAGTVLIKPTRLRAQWTVSVRSWLPVISQRPREQVGKGYPGSRRGLDREVRERVCFISGS